MTVYLCTALREMASNVRLAFVPAPHFMAGIVKVDQPGPGRFYRQMEVDFVVHGGRCKRGGFGIVVCFQLVLQFSALQAGTPVPVGTKTKGFQCGGKKSPGTSVRDTNAEYAD